MPHTNFMFKATFLSTIQSEKQLLPDKGYVFVSNGYATMDKFGFSMKLATKKFRNFCNRERNKKFQK